MKACSVVLVLAVLALADDDVVRAQDKKSVAATPTPKWGKPHDDFVEIAKKGDVDVLFLGDSITAGWRDAGKDVWARSIQPLRAANFGVAGDRTQHVLWRIANGELAGKSRVAVVLIGTNNSSSDPAADIAEGVTEIVKMIAQKSPQTKVLLLAILPRGQTIPNADNDTLIDVNQRLAKLDYDKTVKFLDIGPKFLGANKQLRSDLMPDYLHLSPLGYQTWADAMLPTLSAMLKK